MLDIKALEDSLKIVGHKPFTAVESCASFFEIHQGDQRIGDTCAAMYTDLSGIARQDNSKNCANHLVMTANALPFLLERIQELESALKNIDELITEMAHGDAL